MILAIIQTRLTSKRFPRKVLEKVGGKSLIARVCEAARESKYIDKVVVAWAHKFPHLDENDVLGRFQEIVTQYQPDHVVRLTADCPLLTGPLIDYAVSKYFNLGVQYFYAGPDGFDVQIFEPDLLWEPDLTDTEHVIKPLPKLSVDTTEDLERVRAYVQ
jgi:spore coat polysaccharide biosynthesis protein SpsF